MKLWPVKILVFIVVMMAFAGFTVSLTPKQDGTLFQQRMIAEKTDPVFRVFNQAFNLLAVYATEIDAPAGADVAMGHLSGGFVLRLYRYPTSGVMILMIEDPSSNLIGSAIIKIDSQGNFLEVFPEESRNVSDLDAFYRIGEQIDRELGW